MDRGEEQSDNDVPMGDNSGKLQDFEPSTPAAQDSVKHDSEGESSARPTDIGIAAHHKVKESNKRPNKNKKKKKKKIGEAPA